jgi:hypothetical protein
MGFTMAVMALPTPFRADVPALVWWLVLAPGAGWSLVSAARTRTHRRHHAEHVLGHLAMLYVAVAMAGSTHGIGQLAAVSQAAGLPWFTGTLIVVFTADAVFAGTRVLLPASAGATGPHHLNGQAPLRAPRMPDACHAGLALGMTVMLRPTEEWIIGDAVRWGGCPSGSGCGPRG